MVALAREFRRAIGNGNRLHRWQRRLEINEEYGVPRLRVDTEHGVFELSVTRDQVAAAAKWLAQLILAHDSGYDTAIEWVFSDCPFELRPSNDSFSRRVYIWSVAAWSAKK